MLNKTQNASRAKTASAPRNIFVGGLLLLLAVTLLNPVSRQALECTSYHMPVTSTLAVGNKQIATELVTTQAEQEKGLSGRPCIKDNQAMLFDFDRSDQSNHCFWMKDMRFAIDMVWLDSDKRVVYSARDVQPATYPTNFCPGRPTRYVLEMKANTAFMMGLNVGVITKF